MVCDYGMSTPCLKVSREVLSTNGCDRPFQIRFVSGKKECLYSCVLTYGTMNLNLLYGLFLLLQMCVVLLVVQLLGHSLSCTSSQLLFWLFSLLKLVIAEFVALMLRYWFVGNCSSGSRQIFFALLLVFVCSERCVGPIPYRHTGIQATVLQALNSKWISPLWGNDLGSAG